MSPDRAGATATVLGAVTRFAPRRADYRGLARCWKHDVVAGVTVGVVALPLALAFAIAAGLSPAVGLSTAIVAGLVAAVFDGSDLQVSGPTGAMAVVLLPVVARFGAGAVPTIGLIAGVLVLVAGIARVGRVVATAFAGLAGWGVTRIGTLPSSVGAFAFPALGRLPQLLGPALAVAVLAAMESLRSAKVADALVDTTPCDPDRELFGQGLASIASAPVGGMPSTGAIARTAVNARAGARTRLSAIVHSVTLLVVVLAAGSLVARIPLAALAGVLMVTAVRMVDPSNVWSVLRSTRRDALVLVLTAVATVTVDLIVAIELGLAVAGVLALIHLARSATFTSSRLSDEGAGLGLAALADEHVLVYRIDGPLFFAVAQRFLEEFASVSDAQVVILRLTDVTGLDASAAQAQGDIVEHLERRAITVQLKGVHPEHFRILEAVGSLDHLATEHHVFADLPSAVDHARLHVARSGPSGIDRAG